MLTIQQCSVLPVLHCVERVQGWITALCAIPEESPTLQPRVSVLADARVAISPIPQQRTALLVIIPVLSAMGLDPSPVLLVALIRKIVEDSVVACYTTTVQQTLPTALSAFPPVLTVAGTRRQTALNATPMPNSPPHPQMNASASRVSMPIPAVRTASLVK